MVSLCTVQPEILVSVTTGEFCIMPNFNITKVDGYCIQFLLYQLSLFIVQYMLPSIRLDNTKGQRS